MAETIFTNRAADSIARAAEAIQKHQSSLAGGLGSLKTHLSSNICSAWDDPDFVNARDNCNKMLKNGEITSNDLQTLVKLLLDLSGDIKVEAAKRAAKK